MDETELLQERLQADVAEVEWEGLLPHQERQALFVLDPALRLTEVAIAVMLDDTACVKGWLTAGTVRRPTREEADAWTMARPVLRFRFLIVQPYVLAKLLDSPSETP